MYIEVVLTEEFEKIGFKNCCCFFSSKFFWSKNFSRKIFAKSFRDLKIFLCNLQRKFFKSLKDFAKFFREKKATFDF